jgi:hypothetical protein
VIIFLVKQDSALVLEDGKGRSICRRGVGKRSVKDKVIGSYPRLRQHHSKMVGARKCNSLEAQVFKDFTLSDLKRKIRTSGFLAWRSTT